MGEIGIEVIGGLLYRDGEIRAIDVGDEREETDCTVRRDFG